MVFVMGSSHLLRSPIHPSLFPIPSSSSSSYALSTSSQCICIFSPLRVTSNGRKIRKVSATINRGSKDERNLCARRVILVVGFSVLPVLKMGAMPFQSLASDGPDLKASEPEQKAENKHQGDASGNPFVSFLGGLGILGSGVLTALYSLALKEKAISEATIESMTDRLKNKEATITSMKKKFESDLMNEKEVRKQKVAEALLEQQSLISQLKSANDLIVDLTQDLQKQAKVTDELRVSIDSLQNKLTKAGKDNKELQETLRAKLDFIAGLQEKINFLTGEIKDKDDNLLSLSSALADKETQLQKLYVTNQQLQDQLAGLSSVNEGLKDKLLKNEKELGLKILEVDDLKAQVGVLLDEKDESSRKIDSIQRDYNDLKSSSEKKAAEDAKLLEDQVRTVNQIKEQLESTSCELGLREVAVNDLSQEKDALRKLLDIEVNNAKDMEKELQIKHESLEKSKNQVSELARQLQQSRDLCFQLEAEVSKVRADLAEAKESLQRSTQEAKKNAEVLSEELKSYRALLKKEIEEKDAVSQELAAVTQSREDLQKEVVDVYKKAETAAKELLEEKAVVASLKNELKAFETQVSEEKEARKSIEKDLEETRLSLEEINQNALILSKELELANSQISIIDKEKDVLYNSLAEQKKISQEARENMEDARSLIMRLGLEKETFEKRAKKLEDELASAKGEILRLRSQMKSSTTIVNDQHQAKVEVGAKVAPPPKRVRRRRKTVEGEGSS